MLRSKPARSSVPAADSLWWLQTPSLAVRYAWWQPPPWAQALLIYLATRLFAFVVISRVARFQAASVWTPAAPGYLDVVSLWDGDWYRKVAEDGYPSTLPRDAAGQVQQNQWAFYPLFPAVARLVMLATGASWAVAATLVALAAGAAAAVLLRSLMAPIVGERLALWTVALVCAFPAAPVLQLAYSESLGLLLLVGTLWCLQRGWYALVVPVVLLAGVTRPIGVPLGVVVGLHVLREFRRRDVEPLTTPQAATMVAAAAAGVVAGLQWPVIIYLGSGELTGYTDTMSAWRAGHEIHLVTPWLANSRFVLGDWIGPLAVGLCLVAFVAWVLARSAPPIGFDLRVWCLAYAGYLLLFLDPFTSLVRYLLLLFPLGTLLAGASSSVAYRRVLLLAFGAGQILWVAWLWRFVPPADWPP